MLFAYAAADYRQNVTVVGRYRYRTQVFEPGTAPASVRDNAMYSDDIAIEVCVNGKWILVKSMTPLDE